MVLKKSPIITNPPSAAVSQRQTGEEVAHDATAALGKAKVRCQEIAQAGSAAVTTVTAPAAAATITLARVIAVTIRIVVPVICSAAAAAVTAKKLAPLLFDAVLILEERAGENAVFRLPRIPGRDGRGEGNVWEEELG